MPDLNLVTTGLWPELVGLFPGPETSDVPFSSVRECILLLFLLTTPEDVCTS